MTRRRHNKKFGDVNGEGDKDLKVRGSGPGRVGPLVGDSGHCRKESHHVLPLEESNER